MQGKLIIFSAPSGSGKSTIINYLLQQNLNLAFSISATSRAPRGNERNGVEYYFMSPEEFKTKISNNEFLEYEEVYADKFYGTLKCEVERLVAKGKNVVFDVDVVGGINIKKFYELTGEHLYNDWKVQEIIQNIKKKEEVFENEIRRNEQQKLMLKKDIADRDNKIKELEAIIEDYENSTSWKLTKPLRKIGTIVKK